MEEDVNRVGQRAGLAVAEVPVQLGPGGRGTRRDRAELDAHQGQVALGQGHLARDVDGVFVRGA